MANPHQMVAPQVSTPSFVDLLFNKQPKPAPNNITPIRVNRDGDPYAQAALRNETTTLASTPAGGTGAPGAGRNHALNNSAFSLGQLVGAGRLTEHEVWAALKTACHTNGLIADDGERSVEQTITSGLTAGIHQPRNVPEPTAADAPAISAWDPSDGIASPTQPPTAEPTPTLGDRMIDGARFVLDAPTDIPTVWGKNHNVLWASGEALQIVGGNGVGKTTLAAQIVRARLGITNTVLGLPIAAGNRRVLYLAMDRPAQVQRALARLFTENDREHLAGRMLFWKGPPPLDLAKHTGLLSGMCQEADADTVIVDSLKDAAIGLSEDEVGAGWNRARQEALTAGIEVLELHHNVKRGANGGPPTSISDVYGSAWITAGAGSVIFLHGEPGDCLVMMRHLKQPAEEVGPWKILHDHTRGLSSVHEGIVLATYIESRGECTVRQIARALFDADRPSASQLEKARRRLDVLVDAGQLVRVDGTPGDHGGTTYRPPRLDL
jgi:hypothetical protein